METKEKNLEEYSHPEGVEVKVGAVRINVFIVMFICILLITGALLFNYVWGEATFYDAGYQLGRIFKHYFIDLKGAWVMISCIVGYILLQYVLLYWFSGKDRKSLQWNTDWKSWGFLLRKPLFLKYYRIVLLAPFILLGVLPMIHGFSTGNSAVYFTGIFCVLCSSADCYYFWKLRSFNGNDKIVDGDESLSATIIKGSY